MKRFYYAAFFLASTLLTLVVVSDGARAENFVEGNMTVDKTTVPIQHVYVDQYREEFTVILTDNPIALEMIPDGVHSLSEQGKVRALEFTVSRETQDLLPRMRKAIYFHPVWARNIDIGQGRLTISTFDDKQLVGRMTTLSENENDGHHFSYDISFSVNLQKKPLTLNVTGKHDAPSQAYAAYSGAVLKGDVDEFKKHIPHENIASLPEDQKEIVLGLEFVQDTMMTDIEILTSTISGNKAVLTMKGSRGLAKSDGTVTMILEDGSWKVSEESWEMSP